jgi:hypothetical protein
MSGASSSATSPKAGALRDTARRDAFSPDVDDADCGAGLVTAPM